MSNRGGVEVYGRVDCLAHQSLLVSIAYRGIHTDAFKCGASRSESSLAFGDASAADGARVTEETGRAGATSDKVIARLEHVGNRIRQADDTRPAACPLWGRLLSSRGVCLRCLCVLIAFLVCKTDCDG